MMNLKILKKYNLNNTTNGLNINKMRVILFIITSISFTFCTSKNKTNTKIDNRITDSIKGVKYNKEEIELLKFKMFIGSQKI